MGEVEKRDVVLEYLREKYPEDLSKDYNCYWRCTCDRVFSLSQSSFFRSREFSNAIKDVFRNMQVLIWTEKHLEIGCNS